MRALLSLPPPEFPNAFLWAIVFLAVFIGSLVVLVKLRRLWKYSFFLLVVGLLELGFSYGDGEFPFVTGLILGVVTAVSGAVIPVFYLTRRALRNRIASGFLVISGCVEIVPLLIGFLCGFQREILYYGYPRLLPWMIWVTLWFGLPTLGVYSIIVGAANMSRRKSREQPNRIDENRSSVT